MAVWVETGVAVAVVEGVVVATTEFFFFTFNWKDFFLVLFSALQ